MGITDWAGKDGSFKRQTSGFRDVVSPASDKNAKYPAEKGRYVLYVSYACPWAHRALIVRELKGLQDIIELSVVHPHMGEEGWSFDGRGEYDGQGSSDGKGDLANVIPDPCYKSGKLSDLYFKADKNYDARYTVPIIWDRKTESIVSNESSEIIRFLNTAFDDLIDSKYRGVTYYPDDLAKEIDELNEWVYNDVNNGVYKSGFANKQKPYEEACTQVFKSLDRLEKILDGKRYLIGDRLTEADIRLFTTIIRFDPVYVGHFKCNIRTIRDGYPNIHKWLRQLYWDKEEMAFRDTTKFEHIKVHYYTSHPPINPSRNVPLGPQPNIMSL